MKLTLNLITLFFIFQSSFCQDFIGFRNYLNEGTFWFYEQNFDSAYFYYKKAEKFHLKFYPEEAHLYSRTLWEINKKKKSLRFVEKNGYDEFFKNDTLYYLGLTKIERSKMCSKMQSFDENCVYERGFVYDSLKEIDQFYRKILYNFGNQNQIDSILNLMVSNDSLIFYAMIDEVCKYGYPGGFQMYEIGPGRILMHNVKLFMKHYDFFCKELIEGRMNSNDFAIAYDRYFDNILSTYKPFNRYIPEEEFDFECVELNFQNRCTIGLSPYFETFVWPRFPKRGTTPIKSISYEYYKSLKNQFNCTKVKLNSNLLQTIDK